jgi:hypothetical protein
LSRACAAFPPSPAKPGSPLPATVRIFPERSTTRSACPPRSQTYRFPLESNAMARGSTSGWLRASAPSAGTPFSPFPATVATTPVFRSMLRMRRLSRSQAYKRPPWNAIE